MDFFSVAPQPNSDLGHLVVDVYRSHAFRNTHSHKHTPRWTLWTSDRFAAEPLPTQNTKNTRELLGLQRDSKPLSHQSSGQRPLQYKPKNCSRPFSRIYGSEQG
jgi:hypothetical protein